MQLLLFLIIFLFTQAYSSKDFVPALKLARENGLKLALHLAEASTNQLISKQIPVDMSTGNYKKK